MPTLIEIMRELVRGKTGELILYKATRKIVTRGDRDMGEMWNHFLRFAKLKEETISTETHGAWKFSIHEPILEIEGWNTSLDLHDLSEDNLSLTCTCLDYHRSQFFKYRTEVSINYFIGNNAVKKFLENEFPEDAQDVLDEVKFRLL
jgi:hypothetical protein